MDGILGVRMGRRIAGVPINGDWPTTLVIMPLEGQYFMRVVAGVLTTA